MSDTKQWHIGKSGYDKAIYDDKGANIAVLPDMLPDNEILENARLIAASPDGLAFAKEFLACGENAGHNEKLKAMAVAFIAKATGGN